MSEPTKIQVTKNGPYLVAGEVELTDAEGKRWSPKRPFALCRCGASATKLFCDGSHSRIGFKAAERAVPESKE